MDRIADILVIVDPFHRDQPAIAKAASLARWLGAGIEMLLCDTQSTQEKHNLGLLLEQLAEPLRDDGLDVTTHLISGDPLHEAVVSWMRNSPADLVVKDAHHHSLAKRTFAVDTDRHFIRACPVPLLLTKPKAWGTPPILMAALDPSHVCDPSAALDHRIMDVTVSLARHLDARALAVHAYVFAEELEAEIELRRGRIKQITDLYQVDDADVHVEAAVPTEYVPRMAAELHADIAIMGAIARSALKRALIGSTAEHVLETLPCDVLVVKPPNFAQNLPF